MIMNSVFNILRLYVAADMCECVRERREVV